MVIVIAVDDDDDTHLVVEGVELADAFDDELHVVHVQDREEVEETAFEGGEESVVQKAEHLASDIAADATGEYIPVGRIGRPAGEIAEYVESVDARYLVVGGRKRSPIGKALFGSVTQSVLLNVDAPVVTVRRSKK